MRSNKGGDQVAPLLVSLEERRNIDIAAGGCLERLHSFRQRRISGRPDGGVLLPDKLLRFRRPRHQLGVETHPVRLERLPESCLVQRATHDAEQFLLYGGIIEEAAASAGGAKPDALADHPEASAGGSFVATHDHDSPPGPVLLLA